MITGARSIAEYYILQWIEDNFEENSIKYKMSDVNPNTATITDARGDTLTLEYKSKRIIIK